MASEKNSFILYCSYIHTFEQLSDEEAGKLVKHLFAYVNDKNPVMEDRLLQLVFEPIKQQLKRDLKEWESKKDKKSEAGRLGNLAKYNKDLYDRVIDNTLTVEQAELIAKLRKRSHSDADAANIAVNVNDNVNVNVNVNEEREIKKIKIFIVKEMLAVWAEKNAGYFSLEEKDFEPLQKIAGYLAQTLKVSDNALTQTEEEKFKILERWRDLADFILKTDFIKDYSLAQIEKHFQNILKKEENGTTKNYKGALSVAAGHDDP